MLQWYSLCLDGNLVSIMKYLVLISILIAIGCAPKVQPVAVTSNTDGGAAQKPLSASIKVMSYNIHHCNPPSAGALIDVDTIAGTIRKLAPDIVALQEVDVNTRRSGKIDQAALLGNKTGMKSYFFKAIDHDGGEYGVAILTKLAVKQVKQYALPTVPETKGEPRILATIVLQDVDGREMMFACTHLDAQPKDQNRILQIKEIESILKAVSIPVIIAGDLNAAPGSAVINMFDEYFTRTCNDCPYTIPVINPKKTIDFIGYYPANRFAVKKHEVVNEVYASDHLPVQASLWLK
jgi:endonuclease/exonuclease/phosphatase family metal-dependent hydrolase